MKLKMATEYFGNTRRALAPLVNVSFPVKIQSIKLCKSKRLVRRSVQSVDNMASEDRFCFPVISCPPPLPRPPIARSLARRAPTHTYSSFYFCIHLCQSVGHSIHSAVRHSLSGRTSSVLNQPVASCISDRGFSGSRRTLTLTSLTTPSLRVFSFFDSVSSSPPPPTRRRRRLPHVGGSGLRTLRGRISTQTTSTRTVTV